MNEVVGLLQQLDKIQSRVLFVCCWQQLEASFAHVCRCCDVTPAKLAKLTGTAIVVDTATPQHPTPTTNSIIAANLARF